MRIIIIAAVAENNVIGRSSGEMPWHSKEDFQHFKNTTFGSPVVMGRKTYESLGKPLKGRLNIVITGNPEWDPRDNEVVKVSSLSNAYEYCRKQNFEKIFVIGGGFVFKEAIDTVDEMIISKMKFKAAGDVYFPEISGEKWKLIGKEERSEFTICNYVKKNATDDKDKNPT